MEAEVASSVTLAARLHSVLNGLIQASAEDFELLESSCPSPRLALASAEEDASADDGIVRRSSLLERDGRVLHIHSQPSSAVPMPSAELASGTPRKQAASPPPVTATETAAAEAAVVDAAVPQAEPSIQDTVSLAGIPPPPAPQPPRSKVRYATDGQPDCRLTPLCTLFVLVKLVL